MSVVFAYFLFDFGHGMDVAGGTTDLGYAWGAAGGAIGTGAGALAGLIFCFILFVAYRKILAVNISRDKQRDFITQRILTVISIECYFLYKRNNFCSMISS